MSNKANKVAKWWLVIGLAGAAAVAIFADKDSYESSYSSPQQTREIMLSTAQKGALTKAISDQGYNCPAAKLAFQREPDAYGDVIKVHCGPVGKEGTYRNTVFRVTFTPDDRVRVRPW